MKLLLDLPNGEQLDLFDGGPNGMDYACTVHGEYKIGILDLIEEYERETNPQRRFLLSDEIRDQAYFYAGCIGNFDEELQQMISWDELGEQIYQTLITFAKA